jgi:PAS domain S-box-containing protein
VQEDSTSEAPDIPSAERSSGDGMAALVRAKDWSDTPLGPPDTWPQSLRTAAGICLSSRFPMFLWWGPDLINIYNDAYIPILGPRHPDALGRSAPDVWREVWPVIGLQVEAVMTRGEASWQKRVPLVVERNGFPEEAYFTWSHSPVLDEGGRIAGVLCVVTEETPSVLAERERDRLVEEKRRVDERSRTILESITDAFFALDSEWRFTYANAHAERVLNRRPGDLLGKVLWDEYPGLRGSEFERIYRRAAGERVAGSATAFYPDHGRWYEVHAYPAPDGGIAIYFRDITDRKQAEAEGEQLAAMVNASRDGIFAVGLDRRIRTWNPAAERLFGYQAAEIIGEDLAVLVPPDRLDEPPQLFERVARGESAPVMETKRMRKDGSLVDVAVSLDPVIDAEGRVVAAAATVRDVGWQKRVEADLRAEQERYRALFERAAVGMAEVDLGGHFVRVNAEYGRITGFAPKDLVGRHTSTITHPDDNAADNVLREMMICGGGGTVRREKRYMRQDGEVIWADLAVTLVRDDAGRPNRLISTVADITSRKRAEEQLRRSHDTFYYLIQNNPFGVYVVDADFTLAQVSLGAQKVFANIRPLLGRDFAEVLRAVWAEPFATEAIGRFRHTLDTGEPYSSPSTVEPRQGSGELEAYDWRIERIMLPDGRFGVVCYFYDLSERQRWEATLRESEAALREMAERLERHSRLFERIAATTLDFIYVFDLAGRFLYANRRLLEVWGRTFEDSVGKSLYELGYPQWHADMHMAEIRQVIETKQPIKGEVPFTGGSGISGIYEYIFTPVLGPNGEVEVIAGTTRDVTEQRRHAVAREELLASERAARAEAETLVRVGRSLSAELDVHKLVQGATDAATSLTGAAFGAFFYTVPDAQGEHLMLHTISGVPNEELATFPMPRATDLLKPTFEGDLVIRSDDITTDPRYGRNASHQGMSAGHLPVRSYLAVPVRSRSGEVLGAMFLGHSEPARFTERHERLVAGLVAHATVAIDNARLYDGERAARTEAERQGRMKDEFLATLSHELRTPLNAILGWSQVLRSGRKADPEDVRRGLETIERNARAQTRIIEDLLDMSRIISGKVRLDVQRVELSSVLDAAVATVRHAADAKGVRLQVVLDPNAGVVAGDPARLQQVFWNLLSNSVKHSQRGGRVQVLLDRVNSHVEVNVIDDGEGISPEFLPHVFDRFRQADSTTTRRHGGLGLGLSIVKQLVELHGGTVRAASAGVGQGATFTVMLPLTPVQLESEPTGERRHPRADVDPNAVSDACVKLAGVRVLVVDDEPDARSLLERLLADCEAVVTTAASAAEALDVVRREKPDVVVSDIGMPGEDGYALIRKVRALGPGEGGDVLAVALTAYARTEDRTRAMLAGFQTHVAKPVEPAELVAAVASLARRTGRP